MTTITLPRAVVEQALEALYEETAWFGPTPKGAVAIAALRAALAQQAEPVLQTCNCRWDGEVQVQQCTLHEAHVDAIHEWAERAKVAERKLAQQAEPVAYTTGHCENHKQKGGCQLHNLQCGWPDCDRKPTTAPPQPAEPFTPDAIRTTQTAWKMGYDAAKAETQQGEPVQEPVAWVFEDTLPDEYPYDAMWPYSSVHGGVRMFPVFAPPQRKPLTDEEIPALAEQVLKLSVYYDVWALLGTDGLVALVRAVEQAHGIKE